MTVASACDFTLSKPGPLGIWPVKPLGLAARRWEGLCRDVLSFEDENPSVRDRASDFLDWHREGHGQAFRDGLAILLPRAQDDVPSRTRGDRRDRAAHDLSVALDLDLANRESDGQVVEVVPLPADHECAAREEFP